MARRWKLLILAFALTGSALAQVPSGATKIADSGVMEFPYEYQNASGATVSTVFTVYGELYTTAVPTQRNWYIISMSAGNSDGKIWSVRERKLSTQPDSAFQIFEWQNGLPVYDDGVLLEYRIRAYGVGGYTVGGANTQGNAPEIARWQWAWDGSPNSTCVTSYLNRVVYNESNLGMEYRLMKYTDLDGDGVIDESSPGESYYISGGGSLEIEVYDELEGMEHTFYLLQTRGVGETESVVPLDDSETPSTGTVYELVGDEEGWTDTDIVSDVIDCTVVQPGAAAAASGNGTSLAAKDEVKPGESRDTQMLQKMVDELRETNQGISSLVALGGGSGSGELDVTLVGVEGPTVSIDAADVDVSGPSVPGSANVPAGDLTEFDYDEAQDYLGLVDPENPVFEGWSGPTPEDFGMVAPVYEVPTNEMLYKFDLPVPEPVFGVNFIEMDLNPFASSIEIWRDILGWFISLCTWLGSIRILRSAFAG